MRETKQGSLNFDIENSIAPLLGFRKIVNEQGKYTSQKIFDIMGFSTINIHCNVISGVKDKGKMQTYYVLLLQQNPQVTDKYYTN